MTDYGANGIGFMDGEYMAMKDLRIPVTDMGFQLADMCYDAVHIRDGKFFRLDDHLDKFAEMIDKRRFPSSVRKASRRSFMSGFRGGPA